MLKSRFLSIFLIFSITLMAGAAMADNSVSWISPPDNSTFPVGEIVNPSGNASGGEIVGTGLDLALVIDESGSMVGTPLATVKTAAIALVNGLPQDSTSVAVIGFDTSSHTYRMLTPLNPDVASVISAINSIGAGGGTNIGAGVTAGTNALVAGHTAGRNMMQVVLSDGYGSYYGEAATAYNVHGIITHTVGIPGHNATLMAQVANDGHGVYTNVSDLSTLVGIFDGTGGNLVGLDYVDIELPDGTILSHIATDGLGNFILPDWVIELGAQTFIARAYFDDGDVLSANLTLNGTGAAPVPEPSTVLLLGIGLIGLAGASRKKFTK